MRKLNVCFLFFVLLNLCTTLSLKAQNWQMVWSDEFTNSIGPDWVFEVGGGGWGNNELEYYRQENATIQSGCLALTAKNENFGGSNYTSVRMKTQGKKSWTYGKIEASIAVPSFTGAWPAFWMLGDNIGSVGWPACGEIDIMEHVNTGNTDYGTIHWDNGGHQQYSNNTNVNNITAFHKYTVIWNSQSITWLVDDVQYAQANIANGINGTEEFQKSFFILLNFAIGGAWPGNAVDNGSLPSNMLVDYVRVYQDSPFTSTTDVVTSFADCNYSGFSGGLPIGSYTTAQLQALGVGDNSISSLTVSEGYKAILYDGDNFTGQSLTLTASNNCVGGFNDLTSSVQILPNGVTNLAGPHFLQNRNSGLFMDVAAASTVNGGNIQQWTPNASTAQEFEFTHLGNGLYEILNSNSGKSIDVAGVSKADGTNVQQWDYVAGGNQQFIITSTGDGFYKLIPQFSGKVVEVANASTAAGGNVQQWTNNNQTCGMWNIISPTTGVATAYTDCSSGGFSAGLGIGIYTTAQLALLGMGDNLVSSMTLAEGYQVILYDGDNFTGNSITLTSSNSCIGNFNDITSSIVVKPNGAANMGGIYFLQNRNSGLYMDVSGASTADGANIAQGTFNGGTNQQYQFTDLGNGNYKVLAMHSMKSVDVDAAKTADGTNVQQWTYLNNINQHFIVSPTGDGFYKLIPQFSGKVVEVAGAGMNNGDNIQQWTNNNQTCGQWKFKPITTAGSGTGLTCNYFNGMNFETPVYNRVDATVNFDWGNGSPNAAVNSDAFTARWTGQIQPLYTDTYTFYLNSDNGRRLWINNQLIVDKWLDDWGTEYSGTITLTAGQKYDIRLDYFEDIGGANCKMEWSSFYQDRQVVPQSQLFPNALPTISITAPVNNAVVVAPGSITITATAVDSDGSIAKVDFYNGTTLLGTSTASPFTYSWTGVVSGTYTLTALATDNRAGVTLSAPITVKVDQAPTVSITSPANNATFTSPATVNITATASDTDGTISKVDFYNGTTLLGSDNTSPYSYSWTGVTAGTYTLTAKATDNLGTVTTSSTITIVVSNPNQLPTVNITSPLNNATFTSPATVSITATASDTDGTISKVDFYNGTTLLGSDNASPYSYSWTGVTAGTYTLTAKATDNQSGVTTSSAITIIVSNPNQLPTVNITSPLNNATFTSPTTVSITATASDADGSISKVDFYNGATFLGTDNASPYSYNWTGVTAGTYTLTAKATDNQSGVTTSSAITIVVSNPNQLPTVIITSPSNNATFTSSATVSITATASDADGTISKVDFYNETTLLGSDNTSPYSYSWTGVTAGTYTLTAQATDDQSGVTTSSAITIVVSNPNQLPTVIITSPSNNATFTSPASIDITARASDADGAISKVEFYNGTEKLGEVTSSPYNYTWTTVAAGVYNITVVATDNEGATTTSDPVTITVETVTAVQQQGTSAEVLTLYPNPASASVSVIIPVGFNDAQYSVVDMKGRIVIPQQSLTQEIDISMLDSGVYSILIVKDDQLTVKKLVKY
ncbi:MAG: hypothetical protein JWO58_183 [Chitinophagaceae bacterium]|nr:hypothetical protein [Chitinophagaceae bacterium]